MRRLIEVDEAITTTGYCDLPQGCSIVAVEVTDNGRLFMLFIDDYDMNSDDEFKWEAADNPTSPQADYFNDPEVAHGRTVLDTIKYYGYTVYICADSNERYDVMSLIKDFWTNTVAPNLWKGADRI